MKLKFIVLLLIVSGALLLFISCAYYHPITQPSGSVLKLDMDKTDYTIMGVGEGEACANYFLNIPVGGKNMYKNAVEKAISSKGGDLLIQTSADVTYVYFPIPQFAIFNQNCITVQGLVIKLNK